MMEEIPQLGYIHEAFRFVWLAIQQAQRWRLTDKSLKRRDLSGTSI